MLLTDTHPGKLTVTDPLADKTPHASGRVWYWGSPPSPLLQAVPQNIHATSHARHSGVKAEKQTHKRRLLLLTKTLHPQRCRHFLSLHLSFFTPPSLTASPLLPSAALQPIIWEVTSSCCSQCGGSSVNLCVCWKIKEYTCTQRHTKNNRASLCHCQTC